jgi:hypothetical protein
MLRHAALLAILPAALAFATGEANAQAAPKRVAAVGPKLPPAAFTPPLDGTTYVYDSFSNRIVGTDGLTTSYVDGQTRLGRRLGVFFNDSPREPLQFATDSLAMLWPLSVGKRAVFAVHRGELAWKYEARVTDTERVTVPAGTYDTYVVTTIETPLLTRTPGTVRTRLTTFWYAPAINNVVRLLSLSTAANGAKDTRRVQLVRVEAPAAAPAQPAKR